MSNDELDARMLANFVVGLKRYEEEDPHVRHEPQESIGRRLQAAACAEAMKVRADRWCLSTSLAELACESPLEYLLALAVRVDAEWKTIGPVLDASCSDRGHRERPPNELRQISLCHQHRAGVYRVDLLVSGYSFDKETGSHISVAKVAVEVDGHDFHEKTKEQAKHDKAKDRELQRCGLIVFRFTGSEVWHDPVKVAAEVVDAALGISKQSRRA